MVNSFIQHYHDIGFTLVPLRPSDKAPILKNWQHKNNCIPPTDPPPEGTQYGLAHAYSGTMALDMDQLAKAQEYLLSHGVNINQLLAQDLQICSGVEGHGKLIYSMPAGMVLPSKAYISNRKHVFQFRCATRDGLTMQDALPPSIHPGTGQPYTWVNSTAGLKEIPPELLAVWQEMVITDSSVRQQGDVVVSPDTLEAALVSLDPDVDRDQWVRIGMALHHADPSLLWLFDQWSARGVKYQGYWDTEKIWNSFSSEGAGLVTAATLLRMAREAGWIEKTFAQALQELAAPPPAPQELQPGQVPQLQLTRWGELGVMQFAPVRWLVQEFLPPGVTMLVGKPKFGKSWLVHAILLRIAAGGEMFGHQVNRSKVVYMALEDSPRRLQLRTRKLLSSMMIQPGQVLDNFSVLTECARLGDGLEQQLYDLLMREPELRVIAIDVLAKVRGPRLPSQSLFDYDYSVGEALKRICTLFPEVSILLVHHAAKYAQDSSEATSGTNGLNAGMDNVLVLMKGEVGPVLHIHARDVEDDTPIPLVRGADGMWTMASREIAEEEGMSGTRSAILAAIDSGAHSPADILLHTGFEKSVVDMQLYRMVRSDVLRKQSRGHYVRVTVGFTQQTHEVTVSPDGVPEFLL